MRLGPAGVAGPRAKTPSEIVIGERKFRIPDLFPDWLDYYPRIVNSIDREANAVRSRARLTTLLAIAVVLSPSGSRADVFHLGEVDGLVGVTLAYGILTRTESRDLDFVGVGNGGNALSVNTDDGNLNYDKGIVSNGVRATGELTLKWRNFGAYVRGYGFYDFETELGNREHAALSAEASDLVGSDADFQDYYLSAALDVVGVPVQVRVGNQVLNWGEAGFLRFGVDVINPLDLIAISQPMTTSRDAFVRQGMLWLAANLTETTAIEAFYQYDWEAVQTAPVGWYFSADDLIGGGATGQAFDGFGQFSDRGTDLDAFFGLTPGTLGFDRDFMRIPSAGQDEPDSQGQFGFTVQSYVPALNGAKLALHFVNYHGRLPLISARTANQRAIDETADAAVDLRAAALALDAGIPFADARAIEETLTVGGLANQTRYFATYPEDIQMLGASFSTATLRTGTLISGEVSHQFGWEVQIPREQVLVAALSPIQFTDDFSQTPLGGYGANEVVKGFVKADKTQVSLDVIQLFGPRLGATETLLGFDIGWVRFGDLPNSHPANSESWGYRLTGSMAYESVFGGIGVRPLVVWTHDFKGTSAGPGAAFIEKRKSITAGLGFEYNKQWTASLSYTAFFDGTPTNQLADRDFMRFNLIFYY